MLVDNTLFSKLSYDNTLMRFIEPIMWFKADVVHILTAEATLSFQWLNYLTYFMVLYWFIYYIIFYSYYNFIVLQFNTILLRYIIIYKVHYVVLKELVIKFDDEKHLSIHNNSFNYCFSLSNFHIMKSLNFISCIH